MKKISNEKISSYRKKLNVLIGDLKNKAFKALYPDLLFAGSPQEVFRTCGKKKCICTRGGTFRHGPYKVIQINKKGRQRQIVLRKGREKFFHMAQLYVWHIANVAEVRKTLKGIDTLVAEVIELRSIEEIPS